MTDERCKRTVARREDEWAGNRRQTVYIRILTFVQCTDLADLVNLKEREMKSKSTFAVSAFSPSGF